MRKYYAEALGTFCLVFIGSGAIVVEQLTGSVTHLGVSLAFGLVVLAMIYAIGPISGAHMNPAVSIAFCAIRRLDKKELLPYIAAQLVGATGAAFALRLLFPGGEHLVGATFPSGEWTQSFAIEFLISFILMFVILGVATDEREEGILAGIAISATVAMEALFAGPISGASMNPARSFGPALAIGDFRWQWIYWAAPILGCLAGAGVYQMLGRK